VNVQVTASESGGLAEAFHRDGFVLVPQVFDPAELLDLAEHMLHVRQPSRETLARYRAEPLDLMGHACLNEFTEDELRLAARLLRLHLFDERAKRLMLDERLFSLVRPLWPGEPLAVHAAYYPKPPGSRGMALHADTGYLAVEPPDLVGCIVAIDDADTDNGALSVVRGSHRMAAAERRPIPTDHFLFPEEYLQPPGTELVLTELRAGDVLVFHGRSLHGSMPNRTTNRWRRTFLCHYVSAAVRSVCPELSPAFRSTGEEVPAPGAERETTESPAIGGADS
jgi:phytanoyl-CoA hydroxylase